MRYDPHPGTFETQMYILKRAFGLQLRAPRVSRIGELADLPEQPK
jgi:hypothetical protein